MASPRVRPRLQPSRRRVLQFALVAGPAVGLAAPLARLAPTARAQSSRPSLSVAAQVHVPTGFTPYVGATVADGAQLALFLKAPRQVLLVVAQFPPGADLTDPTAPAATLLGYVPLGALGPGPTVVPWDYTVNGQGLGPGQYFIHPVVATGDDQPTGLTPPPPYLLVIGADNSVQASLALLSILVVNRDGSTTALNPDGSPQ
jgi:hypothetical protein